MSSAVPIHPLVRLARQGSSSLSSVSIKAAPRFRPSRLLSTSSRSQYAKPSNRNAASSSDHKSSKAPQANMSPSASSSSNPVREAEKSITPPIDSIAHQSYAASSRGKPVSPPPAAATVKLTDKRSPQAQKDAEQEGKDFMKGKEEVKVIEKAESSTANARKEDAPNILKGANLHPKAVENDRRASKAAEQKDRPASSSNMNIIDGNTGKSANSSTDGINTGKVTEGIFIPHHNESASSFDSTGKPGPTIDASAPDVSSSTSSTTPLTAGSSSGGGFIPPRSDGRARTEEGSSGPPVTTPISELGQMHPINPLHPFDTHAFIKRLEEAKFVSKRLQLEDTEGDKNAGTSETALTMVRRHDPAEAIMEALRHLLISRGKRVLDHHISKTEVDNQAYLFTAALSELRTELQVRARSDAAALRSMVTLLQREVDGLNQKMREDTGAMKHDIQVDMNNRKSEAKEEQNTLEQEIQDLNNRFTISISDLKTEIEQNVKWDATRSALIVVFGCVVILIATLTAADHLTREEVIEEPDVSHQRRGTGASKSGADTLFKAATRSAEELGLVENANYDEGDGSRYV